MNRIFWLYLHASHLTNMATTGKNAIFDDFSDLALLNLSTFGLAHILTLWRSKFGYRCKVIFNHIWRLFRKMEAEIWHFLKIRQTFVYAGDAEALLLCFHRKIDRFWKFKINIFQCWHLVWKNFESLDFGSETFGVVCWNF